MKHLFKPQRIKWAIIVLAAIAAVKLLWVAVEVIWLPGSGMDYTQKSQVKNLYYRVNFVPTKEIKQNSTVKAKGGIKDIQLLAVYSAPDMAVITVKYKNSTRVLMMGDEINGFVFEGAGKNYATFNKDNQRYTIELIENRKGVVNSTIQSSSAPNVQSTPAAGSITNTGDRRIIDKSLVHHYTSNMKEIFKNIGIQDVKKNGKIEGFKVRYIKKGSHFDQLGLQRGDIIKAVNGEEMNSYNSAFNIYKNIENITNLTFVIQRGNQEMELEYEVN